MIKTIYKLAALATELGGTVYEIAQTGGLLSAARFLELHTKKENEKQPENVQLVTEAYIRFEDREELDRIFLYHENMQSDNAAADRELLKEGCIEDGKLVILYEKLSGLAAKGYHCIYRRAADGHNGRAFARYHAAFGENRMMIPFQMWDSSAYFMGNGRNRALLVTTDFEQVFVMPDIQAVLESICVVHAEQLIREKYDVQFYVERMRWKKEKGEFPEAYMRLQQQIEFVREYYPEIHKLVWSRNYLKRFEGVGVTVGICMDYGRSVAVCLMPDGTISRISNVEREGERSDDSKYCFAGFEDYVHEEISVENMSDIIKKVIVSAEETYKVTVDKVFFTLTDNGSDCTEKPVCEEFVKQGVPEVEYVDYYTAIMRAYAKNEAVKELKEDDIALVCELSEVRMAWTIIRKCKQDSYEKIYRTEEPYPEDGIYYLDEDFSHVYENTFQDVYEDEFGDPVVPGLREVMWSDMDHFMLDAGLREFGIVGWKQGNRKAFQKMHCDWIRIKRQLLRNDSSPIQFQNSYLSFTMDYPIGRLEKCFAPILRNCDDILQVLFRESGVSKDVFGTVLLMGENCEYPFVQKHFEELTDKKPVIVNMLECVAARGAVL